MFYNVNLVFKVATQTFFRGHNRAVTGRISKSFGKFNIQTMGAAMLNLFVVPHLFVLWPLVFGGPLLCNNEIFDVSTQLCCNGTVYPKDPTEDLRCCSYDVKKQKVYNANHELCCGSELIERGKYNREIRCKDDVMYIYGSQLVCGKKLYHNVNISYDRCCGDKKYNIMKHGCCNGEDILNFNLLDRPLTNEEECCGRERMSINSLCLNGKIEPLEMDLCGRDKKYNKLKHVCCLNTGKLLDRPSPGDDPLAVYPNYKCCNDQLMDANNHYCYQGRSIPLGHDICGNSYFNTKVWNGIQEHCCDQVVRNASAGKAVTCCGNRLIELHVNGCCNNMPFNDRQICCDDKILNKTEDMQCCQTYKNKSHACETKKTRRNEVPRCQYCGKRRIDNYHNIINKTEYRLHLVHVNITSQGMTLDLIILRPRQRQPALRVLIPICRCMKEKKIYVLYTDRHLKPGRDFRLNDDDVLTLRSRKNLQLLKKVKRSHSSKNNKKHAV